MWTRSWGAARWAALVAVLAACVALGVGAYRLAGYSWDQVAEYESPYVGTVAEARPSVPATTPSAPRVVLVIVDGLRDDAARRMSTLNNLQGYGADFALVTPEPSLSYPDWTTILTGAEHHVTGVTTNWFEGRVPVPTVLDDAIAAGLRTAVVGPTDFSELYAAERADGVRLRDWPEGGYLTNTLVDDALAIAERVDPALLVVHLPDIDEAGHDHGGTSKEYEDTVRKVDADLARLVVGLQDGRTAFVIVADHGHIDSGGHGGWEPEATRVRMVLGGAGVALTSGEARLVDVAPTVAALMGMPSPAYSQGEVLASAITTLAPSVAEGVAVQRAAFARAYARVLGADATGVPRGEEPGAMAAAERAFVARGRDERWPVALAGAVACLLALAAIGAASRRALWASLAGAVAYFATYNALFFLVHGYRWSLSAFNTEDMVESFMNGRLGEAAASLLVAAAFAAAVYPLFRREPKAPRGAFLAGWLTIGPATALTVLALLGLQVAWYQWAWGARVDALLPDLMWGFKYDLDLVQATAVGLAALLTPLVTLLVGRYHPRIRREGPPEGLPTRRATHESSAPRAAPSPEE